MAIKILLIKRGAIGDILLTTPLIRQIRNNYPDAIIDYCVAKPFSIALQGNKYINNILTLNEKDFSPKGIIGYIKFALTNRKKYDYVFNLGKHWVFNLISLLFSSILVSYHRDKITKLILNFSVPYFDVTRYHVLYYLDLLQASKLANADYSDISIDLPITKADCTKVDNLLNSNHITKYVVFVNSGGNNQYESGGIRMLPDNKAIELIKGLIKFNHTVILIGGKIDKKNYKNYLDKINNPKMLFDFSGQLSLQESAYLIKSSDHFYVTDCGAMHLGVAVGHFNKMTAFFGPTNPRHIIPCEKLSCTVWEDEQVYNPSYQLTGKNPDCKIKFFSKLNVNCYINFDCKNNNV